MKKLQWTKEEEEYLISNYAHENINQLSQRLKKTKNAIRNKASRLKTKKIFESNWTKEQEKYLIANYHKEDCQSLILALGKTKNAIRNKAFALGLRKKDGRKRKRNIFYL